MKSLFALLLLFAAFSSCAPRGYPPDMAQQKSLKSSCKELCKQHQLELIANSLGYVVDAEYAKKSRWGLTFTSPHHCTIDEARAIALDLKFCLLNRMYSDPVFAEGWTRYDSRHPELYNGSLAFKIAFWDENVNRPLFPYVAQMRYINDAFYYFYADPETQSLLEPIVEQNN